MKTTSSLLNSVLVCVAVFFLSNSISHAQRSQALDSSDTCGEWIIEDSGSSNDHRLGVKLVEKSNQNDCSGLFTLENQTTDSPFVSGYSLALEETSRNATVNFLPHGDQFLISGFDLDVETFPFNTQKAANVYISGESTPGSILKVDLPLFVLQTVLEISPVPGGCVFTNDQLVYIALRTGTILERAAQLAFEGDVIGSKNEFLRVIDVFLDGSSDVAMDIGLDCVGDVLKDHAKKPVVILKLSLAYMTWIPKILFDYFKYQAHPAVISVAYVPPSRPITTPFPSKEPTEEPAETLTPTSVMTVTPPAGPPLLDQQDIQSVITWFLYAIENKEISIIEDMVPADGMKYANNIEGIENITKEEFIDQLAQRIDSDVKCDLISHAEFNDYWQIWTINWEPEWILSEVCYVECLPLDPVWESSRAAFFFREKNGEWLLDVNFLHTRFNYFFGSDFESYSCSDFSLDKISEAESAMFCPGSPPPRLEVSGYAHVSYDPPLSNRVRSRPDTNSSILGVIKPGGVVKILEGPTCAKNWIWWKVTELSTGLTGWTVEGDGNEYWVIPCDSPDNCGKP